MRIPTFVPGNANASPELEYARAVVRRCSHLLRDDGNDVDAWHSLGTALAALGYRASAFTALRNAVMLDESRAKTHLALGKLLFDTGCLDDALHCFECAVARP